MEDNKISYKELVELFLNDTIPEIASEDEVPKLNIIFEEEAYEYFRYVMENPYTEDGWIIPNLEKENIQKLRFLNDDESCPTAIIRDYQMFFYYLMEIVNQQLRLYEIYGERRSARNHCKCYMKRFWLRMGLEDFTNVEQFLERELTFIQNNNFEYLRLEKKITEFYGNDVYLCSRLGTTFDESTRQMAFWIQTQDKKKHDLPYIHYGITEENGKKVCYIFGVQNKFLRERIPKVERTLYKLNEVIEEENVHPSRVLVLQLFLSLLRKNNITHIKVPLLQGLNYRYHEIYSQNIKERYTKWDKNRIEEFQCLRGFHLKREINDYENDQIDYIRFVDKQDMISKLKTENLINLFMEVLHQDPELELLNDLDNNDGCLEFKWYQKRKVK